MYKISDHCGVYLEIVYILLQDVLNLDKKNSVVLSDVERRRFSLVGERRREPKSTGSDTPGFLTWEFLSDPRGRLGGKIHGFLHLSEHVTCVSQEN